MMNFGVVAAGTVLYIPFQTYNAAGASVTITGLAATDIEIYKNGSTTQRSSDNGYTLLDTDGIDFDSITGIHGFSVDLSDNSDAGFYAAGSQYWVVVASITADSQTVNFIAATFRIEPAVGINVNVVANAGTAITSASGIQEVKVASIAASAITATSIAADAITAAKVADGTIDAATFATGAITATAIAADAITAAKVADGTIDAATFATGAITATAIAADAITAAKVADGTIDAATFATGAITATAIAADAITDAKVASDVTIASVTGAVGSVTGAVGSVTGNVGGNVTGSVGSVVGAVGSVTGNVGGNVVGSVASVTGLTASDVAAIKLVTDKLSGMTELGTGSPTYYRFGTTALEQAPTSGAAPSAATIADAVWDEARAGHVAGGSFGEGVASVTGAVASVTGNVGGNVVGTVASVVGAVGSVTGLTASDVGAIKAKTDNLPSDPADASVVAGLIAGVETKVDTVDTVVDAVKVQTDKLTFTVANQIDANIQYVNDTQIQGTGAVGSDEWRKV